MRQAGAGVGHRLKEDHQEEAVHPWALEALAYSLNGAHEGADRSLGALRLRSRPSCGAGSVAAAWALAVMVGHRESSLLSGLFCRSVLTGSPWAWSLRSKGLLSSCSCAEPVGPSTTPTVPVPTAPAPSGADVADRSAGTAEDSMR